MSDLQPISHDDGRFVSTDCEDFWLVGAGDTTVRPCRPEHLEHAKAERAKVQAAEAAHNKTSPPNGTGNGL